MEIENILLTSNKKYANFSVTIAESRDLINITADVFEDIFKFPVYSTFSLPKDEKDRDYQRNVLKATINVCRIINGVGGDFISKFVGNELRRITKVPLKCPLAKKTYKFINFKFSGDYIPKLNLPSYFITENVKFMGTFRGMAKVGNNTKFVPFFNARVYGVLGKN